MIYFTADPSLTYATTGRIRVTTIRKSAGVAGNLARVFLRVILTALPSAACIATPRMAVVPAGAAAAQCRELEAAGRSISWVLPDEARSRIRLDAACAVLGPVGLTARTSQDSNAARDSIAVITWNTYLGRGDLDTFVSQLRRGVFTGGDPVEAFVLLLQEVYRRDILARADDFGVHALFVPTLRKSSERDDHGNAILSTFPIGNILIAELPFERQRRLAVGAEIRGIGVDGLPRIFHAVSVHLTTTIAVTRGGPGAARRRQAAALVDALQTIPPPIVIGGDLNTWWGDDEPAVKLLRKEYPDARPLKARDTWRGPLGVGNKLDYLLARTGGDPLVVERIPNRFGSDHYPLIAIFR